MLYYLYDLLQESGIPGMRLFSYVSFRALLSAVIALLVSAWFGSTLIKYFKKKQITETLREFDKNNHLLMHAMAPNVAGVIGSAVAAGILLSFLG